MSCPRNTSSSRTAVYTIATLFPSPYSIICSHDILWCFSRCFHAIDRRQKRRREIENCSKFSAATIKEKESNPSVCIPPLQRRLFFLRALAPRPNLPHRTQHNTHPLPLSPGLPPSIRTPGPRLSSYLSRAGTRLWRYAIITAEVPSNRTQGETWLPEEAGRRVKEVCQKGRKSLGSIVVRLEASLFMVGCRQRADHRSLSRCALCALSVHTCGET